VEPGVTYPQRPGRCRVAGTDKPRLIPAGAHQAIMPAPGSPPDRPDIGAAETPGIADDSTSSERIFSQFWCGSGSSLPT
jgi:hypothetical protein